MARRILLVVTLVFVALLLALTVYSTSLRGVDVLTVTSIVVLLLLGIGIAGALGSPPGGTGV